MRSFIKGRKKGTWLAIPAFGTLAVVSLTAVTVYLFDPESVFVNLLTEAIGVVATVMILDAVWKQREASRLAPLRRAGVHDCGRAFREAHRAWYCIFFGIVRGPLKGRSGANFDDFVLTSVELDLNGLAEGIAPSRSLGDHLVWQFENFTRELDRVLTRFGQHLPPDLVASGQAIERDGFANFVNACRTVKQLQGHYGGMRIGASDLRAFCEQLEKFRLEVKSFAEEHGVDAIQEGLGEPLGAEELQRYWEAVGANSKSCEGGQQ